MPLSVDGLQPTPGGRLILRHTSLHRQNTEVDVRSQQSRHLHELALDVDRRLGGLSVPDGGCGIPSDAENGASEIAPDIKLGESSETPLKRWICPHVESSKNVADGEPASPTRYPRLLRLWGIQIAGRQHCREDLYNLPPPANVWLPTRPN